MDLVDLAKAWRGEPGDKRNTKYAGSAVVTGSPIGPVGYGMYRSMSETGRERRKRSIAERKKVLEMRRKKREKSNMSKASWRGEPGDKRNTKYAASAYLGSSAGGAGLFAFPAYRKLNNDVNQHAFKRLQDVVGGIDQYGGESSHMIDPNFDLDKPLRQTFRDMHRTIRMTPGFDKLTKVGVAGGLVGGAGGTAAYAAYRNKKKKKTGMAKSDLSLVELGKAFPLLGSFKPIKEAFVRGSKGHRDNPYWNGYVATPTAQMRANKAGRFLHRNRTPLMAGGVAGVAGGATGYMASRNN